MNIEAKNKEQSLEEAVGSILPPSVWGRSKIECSSGDLAHRLTAYIESATEDDFNSLVIVVTRMGDELSIQFFEEDQ